MIENTKDITEKLLQSECNVLIENKSQQLEKKIKYGESLISLKTMKNSKIPSSDGFIVDCYTFFLLNIGHFILVN